MSLYSIHTLTWIKSCLQLIPVRKKQGFGSGFVQDTYSLSGWIRIQTLIFNTDPDPRVQIGIEKGK